MSDHVTKARRRPRRGDRAHRRVTGLPSVSRPGHRARHRHHRPVACGRRHARRLQPDRRILQTVGAGRLPTSSTTARSPASSLVRQTIVAVINVILLTALSTLGTLQRRRVPGGRIAISPYGRVGEHHVGNGHRRPLLCLW